LGISKNTFLATKSLTLDSSITDFNLSISQGAELLESDGKLDLPENSHTCIGEQTCNSGFFFRTSSGLSAYPPEPITNAQSIYFVDGIKNQRILNPLIKHYLELLKSQQTEPAKVKISCIKDFFAKTSESASIFENTRVLEVDLELLKLVEPEVIEPELKIFNLKDIIDEKELSNQAVDLNIKLMKWREMTELDLDLLHNVKCLLLGAGTLGCQLSRNLVGWGVKNITFVDYGKVSHSNPVRQTLFTYEHALHGGRSKAEVAAEQLNLIQPSINARGFEMKIPMPGHVIRESEIPEQLANAQKLEELIIEHDAIFLLLDTREARWLGTLLASVHNKICISVGLGFDNFVIIRHGVGPLVHNQELHGERSGCYFCNDYLSPSNTMRDRTLDQQCTVTRPGLSFISSAYASELLVNYIHMQPSDILKPGDTREEQTSLGYIPQHIRGNVGMFNTQIMYSSAFEQYSLVLL